MVVLRRPKKRKRRYSFASNLVFCAAARLVWRRWHQSYLLIGSQANSQICGKILICRENLATGNFRRVVRAALFAFESPAAALRGPDPANPPILPDSPRFCCLLFLLKPPATPDSPRFSSAPARGQIRLGPWRPRVYLLHFATIFAVFGDSCRFLLIFKFWKRFAFFCGRGVPDVQLHMFSHASHSC